MPCLFLFLLSHYPKIVWSTILSTLFSDYLLTFLSRLRLKVIKNSIATESETEVPRVVEILYYDISKGIGSDGWPYHRSNHKHKVYSDNPTLHQVNKEFRDEALKTWSVRINTPRNGRDAGYVARDVLNYKRVAQL